MSENSYDVLIAGAGIAGLYAALQFRSDVRVLLLSKGAPTVSGSSLAQGGVAAVLDHTQDSFEFHFNDTMIAGGCRNTPETVELLTREGPEDVRRIMEWGVDFDSDANGVPLKTLEGGHSRRRIVHWRDQTGKEIVDTLLAMARQRKNITLCEQTTLCALQQLPAGFCAQLLTPDGMTAAFASFALLATGGVGRVFQYTTNPVISTGDGIRLAHELGAKIKNLSAIQFHPTAFRETSGECFLISEAVRGEGAYLRNGARERFMERYDERLELAPRDVVSRAIMQEARRTNDTHFYLDITHKPGDYLRERFPGIYAACAQRGVDMAADLIPVFPCQHYLMGGIDVDLESRTTLPRLYAAGECAHTGLHGANRLASNSLPEALVFGRRAALDIARCLNRGYAEVQPQDCRFENSGSTDIPPEIVPEIQRLMQKACFVLPNAAEIPGALQRVSTLREDLYAGNYRADKALYEARSIAAVAEIVLGELAQES